MKNLNKKIKSIIKEVIFWFLNFYPPTAPGLSILMYHSVGDNPVFFSIKKDVFAWQMNYLKQHGYKPIFLSEAVGVLERGQWSVKNIVITFDDGYKDIYTNAFPVLKELGFKATVFVVTDGIGSRLNNSASYPLETLNLEELKNLDQNGLMEIEPHTKTHPKLTQIPLSEAKEEILGSKLALEKIFSKTCQIFSYPKGRYNQEVIKLVKELGFKAGVTVEEGTNKPGADLYKLKRNSIDSLTFKNQFIGKINGSIDIFNKFFRWQQ